MGAIEKARRLSFEQRELLILHVAGPQPVVCLRGSIGAIEKRTAQALVDRGMIRYGAPGQQANGHPKVTTITEYGREAAAFVLAHCAELIVRSGKFDESGPASVRPNDLAEFRLLVASAAALTDR